jgi:hypothetical protein
MTRSEPPICIFILPRLHLFVLDAQLRKRTLLMLQRESQNIVGDGRNEPFRFHHYNFIYSLKNAIRAEITPRSDLVEASPTFTLAIKPLASA